MSVGTFCLTVSIASLAASVSDWLFMGVLFHDKYYAAPIWRPTVQSKNRDRIIVSQAIGVLCCAAFASLCILANALTIGSSLLAAALVWLAGPVVVLVQMVLWIKLHPLIGLSHALGWLSRLIVTALLVVGLFSGH